MTLLLALPPLGNLYRCRRHHHCQTPSNANADVSLHHRHHHLTHPPLPPPNTLHRCCHQVASTIAVTSTTPPDALLHHLYHLTLPLPLTLSDNFHHCRHRHHQCHTSPSPPSNTFTTMSDFYHCHYWVEIGYSWVKSITGRNWIF